MTKLNEVYYKYLSIQDRSFEEKHKFVIRHRASIDRLNPSVRIEIYFNYLHALASLERHRALIPLAQGILELAIINNVKYIASRDVYKEVLYLKGISHIEVGELQMAKSIFVQLCNMYPREKPYFKALSRINHHKFHPQSQKLRAASILLFLLTATIIAFELLLVTPFYYQYLEQVRILRHGTFLLGLVLMCSFKLRMIIINYKTEQEVKRSIEEKKKRS